MLLTLALFATIPTAQDMPVEAPKPKKEARICRRIGATGSRMDQQRICKTKSEWAAEDAANNTRLDTSRIGNREGNRGDR